MAYFGGFIKSLSHEDFEDATVITTQSSEDITLQQADADDQINSIFAEVGSGTNDVNYHFQVWRLLKDQAEMTFLFKGLPSDLPIMERLRDEYDGGKFHIQIYRNKKRYKQLKVSVEQPKKAAVAAMVKNDMAEIMNVMGRQQQDNFNMLKDTVMQMVGKPSTPQPSQMEMMTGMMMLMKSMKDFVVPPVQQTSSFDPEKMFDMFLKGMEVGRESGGGGETGLMDLAKELIKSPLLGTLAQAATTPVALPRPAPLGPKPTLPRPTALPEAGLPSINPTTPPVTGDTMQSSILKHYLNLLVQKAEKDSDPILYAELILDSAPQNIIEQIILREDLIEYASTIDPRVKQHSDWFMELRNHIHGVLTGQIEDSDTVSNADTADDTTDDTLGGSGHTPDA